MIIKINGTILSTTVGALISVTVSLFSISSVLATEFDLVTTEEYLESVNAGENTQFEFIAKAVPGGPKINVLSPLDSAGVIGSPVDIEVAFESAIGSSIDMSSLKIYYLMFVKKDVTNRILEHATISENSISANGANLPSGTHKFLIQIHDSEKRIGSKKIVVNVGD